jgi:hypothetical protein
MTAGNPGPVLPDRYAAALGGVDPIESMRKAPKRLKKLLKGVSEKRLKARPAESKWSVKEIIAHLADGEVMLGSRFRLVAAMDRPPLLGYDQDAYVERLAIEKARTEDLLEDFAAVRKANVRLLERLPSEALSRVGLHSERGEESLADMLVMYAGHDHVHEEQIARMLAAKRSKRGGKVAGTKAKAEPSAAKGSATTEKPSRKPQSSAKGRGSKPGTRSRAD